MGNYISSEREHKAVEIQKAQWNYVLLGNSKSGMMDTSGLPHKSFNAAFGSGLPVEFFHFTERYLKDPNCTIIIGLDIYKFSKPLSEDDEKPFSPKSFSEVLGYVISLKAVEYSFKTILKCIQGKTPTLKKNGDFGRFDYWEKLMDVENNAIRQSELDRLYNYFKNKSDFSESELYYHKRLSELLKERNIPYIVFFHPMHENVIKRIRSLPHYDKILKWKEKVNDIFGGAVVDFSEKPFSATENFFYCDPVHYRPPIGAEILKKIL
jgi:hypothetical protein